MIPASDCGCAPDERLAVKALLATTLLGQEITSEQAGLLLLVFAVADYGFDHDPAHLQDIRSHTRHLETLLETSE